MKQITEMSKEELNEFAMELKIDAMREEIATREQEINPKCEVCGTSYRDDSSIKSYPNVDYGMILCVVCYDEIAESCYEGLK